MAALVVHLSSAIVSVFMSVIGKLKRAVRGDVDPKTVLLEARRRTQVAKQARRERTNLERLNSQIPPLRLQLSSEALLDHFQTRSEPRFFPGFSNVHANAHKNCFPKETDRPDTRQHTVIESSF